MAFPERIVKDSAFETETFENFAENINGGIIESIVSFPEYRVSAWNIALQKFSFEGTDYLSIFAKDIISSRFVSEDSLIVNYAFHVENERFAERFTRQRVSEKKRWECWLGWRRFMRMDTILAPGSGFLEDGALKISVEFRVMAVTDKRAVRLWNFTDPFEGSVKLIWRGLDCFDETFLMIRFHSPDLAAKLSSDKEVNVVEHRKIRAYAMGCFLQLIHGSKCQIPERYFFEVLWLAAKYNATTVLRHCVQYRNDPEPWDP